MARNPGGLYVIEDAHWIDEVSESMLADFLTVIPQTPSLVLVTYRPEYTRRARPGARCPDDRPGPAERSGDRALVSGCSGTDPSVAGWLATVIVERAAGNPFFAEEIVRELAERGVLHGDARCLRIDGRTG